MLLVYWTYISSIEIASNCKFNTTQSVELIQTEKIIRNCIIKLSSEAGFTHFNSKDEICWFKKGYVNPHNAIYNEESVCAYYDDKIS